MKIIDMLKSALLQDTRETCLLCGDPVDKEDEKVAQIQYHIHEDLLTAYICQPCADEVESHEQPSVMI